MNLYEIANDIKHAIDDFLESEEDFAFDDMQEAFDDKCIGMAAYIKNLEAEAVAVAEAAKNMQERKKSLENKAERLKKYIMQSMQLVGQTVVDKSPNFVIKVKKNPASILIKEGCQVPEEYLTKKIEYAPNKVLMKEYLSSGGEIPGVALINTFKLDIK